MQPKSKGLVEISLAPTNNRVLPKGILNVMQLEYATKYLESIRAKPTKENIDFVINNLSIKTALVMPVWAREKIVILPGMKGNEGELSNMLQDIKTMGRNKKNDFDYLDKDDESNSSSVPSLKRNHSNYRQLFRTTKLTTVADDTLVLLEPLIHVLQINKKIAESFKVLLTPPSFEKGDLMSGIMTFIASIVDFVPRVKDDKSGELFKSIRRFLPRPEVMRLFALLIHFCYWNIIHPVAKAAIVAIKDNLVMESKPVFETVNFTQDLESRLTMPHVVEQIQPPTVRRSSSRTHSVASDRKLQSISQSAPTHDLHVDIQSISIGSNESFHSLDQHFTNKIDKLDFDKQNDEEPTVNNHNNHNNDNNNNKNNYFEPNINNISHDSFDTETIESLNTYPKMNFRTQSFFVNVDDDENDLSSVPFRNNDNNNNNNGKNSVKSNTSEGSLSAIEKEQLFLQLEACWISLFKEIGTKRIALVAGRQALVSCCHFVVDDILTTIYPWFSSISTNRDTHNHTLVDHVTHDMMLKERIYQINLQLRRLVHNGMADFIDPSRLYSSKSLTATLTGQEKIYNDRPKGKSKYVTTSVAIQAIFNDTSSYQARKFLSNTKSSYVPLPGNEGNERRSNLTQQIQTKQKHSLQRNDNKDPSVNYFPRPQTNVDPSYHKTHGGTVRFHDDMRNSIDESD
eukprot:gene11265-15114_t